MGATLEQDLAINFLEALTNIWSRQSGTWEVEEIDDPLRAFTHITIRWLAAMAREEVKRNQSYREVRGRIIKTDANVQPADAFRNRENVSLLEALNKIVHGEPQWVSVRDGEVILCWKFTPGSNPRDEDDGPYSAYFLSYSLLSEVRHALYSHLDRRNHSGVPVTHV
jgi:hypothetical protein